MKTNQPHPRSFLYFAARVYELTDCADRNPDALINSVNFTAEGNAIIVERWQAGERDAEAAYARAAMVDLRKKGVPEAALDHPEIRKLVDEHTKLIRTVCLFRPWMRAEPPRFDQDGAHRPRRETISCVLMGAFMEAGGKRAAAARLCNLHAPRGADNLVSPEQIRDGVRRFSRDNRYVFRGDLHDPLLDALALTTLLQYRVATRLWGQIHAARGSTPVDVYFNTLVRNGRLFQMWDAALGEEDKRSRGNWLHEAVSLLLYQQADLLRQELKRRGLPMPPRRGEFRGETPAGNAATSAGD